MQSALRMKTRVMPGNKIEISSPELPVGDAVEVIVVLPEPPPSTRRSALDILEDTPGGRLFKTSQEADHYLEAERDSWEH